MFSSKVILETLKSAPTVLSIGATLGAAGGFFAAEEYGSVRYLRKPGDLGAIGKLFSKSIFSGAASGVGLTSTALGIGLAFPALFNNPFAILFYVGCLPLGFKAAEYTIQNDEALRRRFIHASW